MLYIIMYDYLSSFDVGDSYSMLHGTGAYEPSKEAPSGAHKLLVMQTCITEMNILHSQLHWCLKRPLNKLSTVA